MTEKNIKSLKLIVIILFTTLTFLAAISMSFLTGIGYQQSRTIPHSNQVAYLIRCMETARNTHQYFVDNPGHYYGQDAFTQEEWVKVYNETIEILESLR